MTAEKQVFVIERIPTPIGGMWVVSDRQQRLRALDWEDFEARMLRLLRLHYGDGRVELVRGRAPDAVRAPLTAYLSGDLRAIERVAVETGGTAFQREIWAALRRIPVGETLSYGALATKLGKANAVRAVGLANGANPIGVVVPCHRVVGSNGRLTGYAGGLSRKRWLLAHEGVQFADEQRIAATRGERAVA